MTTGQYRIAPEAVKQPTVAPRLVMTRSRWLSLLAALCYAVWIGLAFVRALPSGWVHVALVAGVLLTVRAIVDADAERARRT